MKLLVSMLLSLVLVACAAASTTGAGTDCERSCTRDCNARCSQELAQCEVRCDNVTPMDLGNTEKQAPMSRNDNPQCRGACSSQEQTCLRTCRAGCAC